MRHCSFTGLIRLAVLVLILVSSGIYVFGQCEAAKLHEISLSGTNIAQLAKTYGGHRTYIFNYFEPIKS